ncbi:MAG TPA: ABC-F family ATP-binding cassette domain-containing protein [Candidatus Acidoferrum sp.]|nr:ABC-F family ATP-binding cassette domain-containing protein [Candidatus Acidoferrum sp.]
MIQIEEIGKSFGGQVVLRDLTWHITRGQRVGLVGPNGAGKTTLCRILTGEMEVDAGQVRRAKTTTIGYLPQEIAPAGDGTVLGHLLAGFPEIQRLEDELELLATEMAETEDGGSEDLTHRYGDLQHQYEVLGGYSLEARAKAILGGLGFRPDEFHSPLAKLSGGWRMRVALGRLLLQSPDLLLLDEPTNHLDLESLQWLEDFLAAYEGTVVIISHDRYFLNRVVDRIAELELGRFSLYTGDYDDYQAQKLTRQEQIVAAQRTQAEQIEKMERFIRKFRYKATKARQVQSRIKQLDKIERVEVIRAPKRIHFHFPQPVRSGTIVSELRKLRKAYGNMVVYAGIDFRLMRGDRVALVGVNGAGKSTLLKIVAGVLPFEAGERILGHNVSVHYYAQHQLDALNPKHSVLEELAEVADAETQTRLRTILGAFLFSGDDVEKPVTVLSGGEKSRLALAKMLLHPANLLCLDEPTNHLDVTAREVLEEALDQFDGSMLFISHDRYFINRIATKVVEVRDGRLWEFAGDYDYYLDKKAEDQASAVSGQRSATIPKEEPGTRATARVAASREPNRELTANGQRPTANAPKARTRDAKRAEAEARQHKSRMAAPLRARLKELEAEIAQAEARIQTLSDHMANPDLYKDGDRAREVARERKALEEQVRSLYGKWEELALRLESVTAGEAT